LSRYLKNLFISLRRKGAHSALDILHYLSVETTSLHLIYSQFTSVKALLHCVLSQPGKAADKHAIFDKIRRIGPDLSVWTNLVYDFCL